ncbi:hypothetical protein LZ518_01475 [Sphingomonas sp. RB56-2]|uniref:Alpha-L-glutamate ligase-related protein ATP-grasp domain-containing protein n=1 Tax=Sphingomonas brevis TaxID=2908206 RepID=A0ABT0S5Z3_9SPHN|nr:sugar-transfer associated ATP-grasp domain-containing protein [Sphingomonas brevis]MCL6739809.1 hypothetical protein [Sphingomonas brevis]
MTNSMSEANDQIVTLKAAQKSTYRVAGVPVILRRAFASKPTDALELMRAAYARNYFRTVSAIDRRRALRALVTWPFVFVSHLWIYARLNGRIVADRYGRSIPAQVADQVRLYLRHGILPRWYYIFSLYEERPRRHARDFLNRFETKLAIFRLINWPGTSPLNDKAKFAAHCLANGIDSVPLILIARDRQLDWLGAEKHQLPPRDLFIKPLNARGGKGAERWDHAGGGVFTSTGGKTASSAELVARLLEESESIPRLVQPRMVNHPAIADLSNGALSTARIMTCLDEKGGAEVVAAVFRMAIGRNTVVDNIHAGGIAAEVGLTDGKLGPASNLGDDVRLGWLSTHPDTGAAIEGRTLPLWREACLLAVSAHKAFSDRTVIGWDIAITADGPMLVEGNSGPDVDLLQRPMRRGLGAGRLGELIAFHLVKRGISPPL